MDGSNIHFEEIVANWNTEFDDVNTEFDDVIRSERGPGKFYDNTSPDENPEAFLGEYIYVAYARCLRYGLK
jgi:hypothetical protein